MRTQQSDWTGQTWAVLRRHCIPVLIVLLIPTVLHCASASSDGSFQQPVEDVAVDTSPADTSPTDTPEPADSDAPNDGDIVIPVEDIVSDIPEKDATDLDTSKTTDTPEVLTDSNDGTQLDAVEPADAPKSETSPPATDSVAPDSSTYDAVDPTPAAEPLFRLDSLTWGKPQLCYATNDEDPCVELTALVNALIATTLDDDDDPTDVLIQFHGAIDTAGSITVSIGDGTCERDAAGVIIGCSFPPNSTVPPVTYSDVIIETTKDCAGAANINAPCFATPTKDGVVLMVGGISIGLKQAAAWGMFSGINPNATITGGLLTGFMPKTLAQTIQFNLPTGDPLTLSQLLAQIPTIEVDGHPGWTLEFNYQASQQPNL